MWLPVMREPLTELYVQRRWLMPRVDQLNAEGQLPTLAQIFFGHSAPIGPHRFRNLGIPIAGQVGKIECIINQKEVDTLRPPRRVRRSGQPFSLQQRVY